MAIVERIRSPVRFQLGSGFAGCATGRNGRKHACLMCQLQPSQGSRVHVEALGDSDERFRAHQFQRLYALPFAERGLATERFATCPRGSHAGAGAFADQRAFELGKRSHHVEDQRAAAGLGADGFGQGFEVNVSAFQEFDELEELGYRPAEAIKAPDNEDVAGAQAREGAVQAGSTEIDAGDAAVGKDELASGALEGVTLEREVLLLGGDASVTDFSHGFPFQF